MEIILKDLPRKFKKVKMDSIFDKLVKNNIDFYVRRGSECNELIYEKRHQVYGSTKGNFPKDKVFLFNNVQQDCKKFLVKYSFIDLPPKVDVSNYNWDYDHESGVITGTDLNHAFWRIAYVKGYISKKTYEFGLDDRAKALRLATLSVLGREKKYDKFIAGKFVESVVLKEKNEKLQNIYKDIRYSCYYMMHELSQMLGKDFDCWRTDCIYYRDTPENRKIVHDYFEEREMMFKQLVYNSMDAFKVAENKTENL